MSEYKAGERVRVTFEAVVTGEESDFTAFSFRLDSPLGGYSDHVIWSEEIGHPGLTIEKLDPANWPPQAGDVWTTDADNYFIAQDYDAGRLIYIRGGDRTITGPVETLLGRPGLELAYRKS